MTIDPVNRANQVSKSTQAASVQKNEAAPSNDSINISKDAKELAEIKRYIKIVQDTPGIRVDKVEQAKKNLESYLKGNQLDEKVLEKITDRILDAIF